MLLMTNYESLFKNYKWIPTIVKYGKKCYDDTDCSSTLVTTKMEKHSRVVIGGDEGMER